MAYTEVAIIVSSLFALVGTDSPRIINGTEVDIRDRPYQVALHIERIPPKNFACGGTLIGNRWVLSAAHCFENASAVAVRIGSTFRELEGHIIKAFEVVLHPNYDPRIVDFDYALVKLRRAFSVDSIARSIEMVDENETIEDGTVCTASGWGITMGTGDPASLKVVDLPVVNWTKCAESYKETMKVTENMMCAGYDEGLRDTCGGDSGGPLICSRKLTGVVSWGGDCAKPNAYGVYAVVSKARSWIKDVTGI